MKKKSIDIVLVGSWSEEFLPRLRRDIETMSTLQHFVHYFDNTDNPRTLSVLWNDLAAKGSCEYIAIMNPDIALSPSWDQRLVKALVDDKNMGVATPDPCGSSPTAAPIPSVQTMKEISKERSSNHLVTTQDVQFYLAVVRRKQWEVLKGVDERMRFYMQDSDFLRRAKERLGLYGARVHSCPVWHQGSAATGEAIRLGKLNQSLEYETSLEVHTKISSGHLKDWDLMTDLDRAEVRSHPKYGRMGA